VLSIWEKPPRVLSVDFASPRFPQFAPQFSTNLHLSPQISRISQISTVRLNFCNPRPMCNRSLSVPSAIAPSVAYWITPFSWTRGWTLCLSFSSTTMPTMLLTSDYYRCEMHLYGNEFGWRRVPSDLPRNPPSQEIYKGNKIKFRK